MKITFSLFLKYWFLLTCLVNWICIYIWLILILWLFLFVQLSNQPPIINTYLNISICLCSIRSKRLSCMNVESCFWKYLNFILYVLNVLWNKWKKKEALFEGCWWSQYLLLHWVSHQFLDWHRIFQLWQPVALRLPSILDGFDIICYCIVGTRNIVQTSVKRSFIIVLLSDTFFGHW